MNNLIDDHASVNDVIRNVNQGNVHLRGNAVAHFIKFTEIEWAPIPTPSTVRLDGMLNDGAIKVKFKIPSIDTRGHQDDPDYSDYWFNIYFYDGSYLSYFVEVTWNDGLMTYFGGITKFFHKLEDGTFEESSAGVWGTPIDAGTGLYWYFNDQDPSWDPMTPQIPHWWSEPFFFTNEDEYYFYIFEWDASPYKLGYAISGSKLGPHNIDVLYGNETKNMPFVQWLFVNGWEMFYDYLAGVEAGGTQYPGEDSETGGGTGDFYGQNDWIDIPDFPSIQAIDFGFNTIYNPTIADIQAISRWLWSDDFSDNIKMNFIDPFNNILALAMVPLNISSEVADFKIGNTNSGIQTHKVNNQYIEVDCGSLNVREYWGNFLDYSANYSLWLPYIGYRSLKPDDMVDGELGVVYHIDLLTGAMVCFIWAYKEGVKHVLYSYSSNIFYSIALSGANYMSMYNQQLAATVAGNQNFLSKVGSAIGAVGNIAQKNYTAAAGNLLDIFKANEQQKLIDRQYETAKPEYGRGGNAGGNTGLFSIKYPYLIKSQAIGQTPKNYKNLVGIPSQIYKKLDTLRGYTEIAEIKLDDLNISTAEKIELLTILTSGFYINIE